MRLSLVVALLATVGLAWAERVATQVRGPILLIPGDPHTLSLRLEITIDGDSPDLAWNGFLDRFFAFFDRDQDGALSRAEVGRMFPLPRRGQKELTFDFAKLDTDRNGRVSRDELKRFCRREGFGPIVVVLAASSADDARLGKLFFDVLDSNRDGVLVPAELKQASVSVRPFDANDDEFLERGELLAAATSTPAANEAPLKLADKRSTADAIVRIDLGVNAKTAKVAADLSEALLMSPVSWAPGCHRLHGPGGSWSAVFRTTRSTPDVKAIAEFLTAQFKTAAGDGGALSRADVAQDARLSGLQELFSYADRDGDERLTLPELEEYLRLIEVGVGAQVWLQIADHGRNPFPSLDADGDGRLDVRELNHVSDLYPRAWKEARRLPRQLEWSFGVGSALTFGGMYLPAPIARRRTVPPLDPSVPPWFRAMDRNQDGWISPREFLGTPELFRRLDMDGDGLITPIEAVRKK